MDTRSRIRSFITSNFHIIDPEQLTDDASLLEQGIVDSTGILEIVDFLETQLGVVVDDRDLVPENLDSIDGIVAFVARPAGRASTSMSTSA